MSSLSGRFIAQIHRNLDAWREGDIDFATYSESQRELWEAIREAGKDVEAEVVAALAGPALLAEVRLLEDANRQTAAVREASGAAIDLGGHPYVGVLERTQRGPVLCLLRDAPACSRAASRGLAALIFWLAADMERRSQPLEAHWTIRPDAERGRIALELAGEHEAELADEFIARILFHHQLI